MENSFLRYVAEDLVSKFGTNLARVAVVFPNKRASLFLNDHLARLADEPVWSPAYITISDLFRHHSTLAVADPIKLVCDLHRVFTAVTGKDESLDQFFSWGQLLLSDFDDIDKNLADARRVFANIRDIRELDDTTYLSTEQKALLAKFFANFQPDKAESQLKEKFLTIWNNLYQIYTDFNARLSEQGLAYEGSLYRQVATQDDIDFKY
ncbi:MAG: PD-(D/E)XK nuclease family protein, partial [Prevotella sp.]|nr:PD-(D/E)XK nuclease family protein [Prevotella sp.]